MIIRSDDNREHDSIRNAALVSTKLHTLQLNEEYDEDEYVTDVRHNEKRDPVR